MSPPYESELCYALGPAPERGTVNPAIVAASVAIEDRIHTQRGLTTNDYGPSAELQGMIHNPTDAQWADVYSSSALPSQIYSYSMSTLYVMQIPEAQLAPASASQAIMQSTQASCSRALCQWRDESAPGICGFVISCEDVPAHFKDIHNIKRINESKPVGCRWEGCFTSVARKNFARHVRECHLNHSRDEGHAF